MKNQSIGNPIFSIILPTRNRARSFERALRSVLAQNFENFEVIVVNDGSSGDELESYHIIERQLIDRVAYYHLVFRENGHGPSYSRNYGAYKAKGKYLCFLDDDDIWIDSGHLQRCFDTISESGTQVDLYFTDQRAAFSDGQPQTERIWISGVEKLIKTDPDRFGSFVVKVDQLVCIKGFAHMNCSVYRRVFYNAIGGMDETLRYENDHDLYIRAIDAADLMFYNPSIIAQHHIPDSQKTKNVSTAISLLEKKLFQLRIFDKAILSSKTHCVSQSSRKAKGYVLKNMAVILENNGRLDDALFYMKESLLISFSFKWLAYTTYCWLKKNVTKSN